MRFYVYILFVFSFFLGFCQRPDVLSVAFEVSDEKIIASWTYKSDSSNFTVSDVSSETFKKLNYLRNALVYKWSPSDQIISTLSMQFFGEINEQIKSASYLNIVISDTLLLYPFDLFILDGEPLFRKKKIYYSFKKLSFLDFKLTPKSNGLIIRDSSADPDDACGLVNQLYSESSYYNTNTLSLSNFETFHKPEYLLISAHGVIRDKNNGFISLNEEAILPSHIARLNSDLIYFDSCNLGISKSFLSAAEQSGTKFLLAPIVKNQAGNSSTLTIKYFFESLQSGMHPIDALFFARNQVYDHFSDPMNNQNLLWYSFPFRIYALK